MQIGYDEVSWMNHADWRSCVLQFPHMVRHSRPALYPMIKDVAQLPCMALPAGLDLKGGAWEQELDLVVLRNLALLLLLLLARRFRHILERTVRNFQFEYLDRGGGWFQIVLRIDFAVGKGRSHHFQQVTLYSRLYSWSELQQVVMSKFSMDVVMVLLLLFYSLKSHGPQPLGGCDQVPCPCQRATP